MVAIAIAAAGCAPSCERVCRKARECDLATRLSQEECTESCERQVIFYEIEGDKDLEEDFAAHRRCVAQATCDELQDGECYDPDLFLY